MSQIEQVIAENAKLGAKDESEEIAAFRASLAVALFAASQVGLVKFPAGALTIGEIESKLDTIGAAFLLKLCESHPELR